MKVKRCSYLMIALSLVAVFMLAIAAGCTGNGSTNTASTQSPAATPITAATAIADSPAGQATTTVPVTTSAPVSTGQKQTIKISGSTTVLPIAQAAAEAYMAVHPDADIQISGGGSGVGIQAIGAKTVDIGMTSREVTKDEMANTPTSSLRQLRRMASLSLSTRPIRSNLSPSIRSGRFILARSPNGPRLPEQMFPAPTTRSSLSGVTAHQEPGCTSNRVFCRQMRPRSPRCRR